ncbi:MAG: competence/damage-inducible protein A [Candidatus Hodarchaeota archaeon]
MALRVELLIIGNEILSGRTLDTNSQWLAQHLFELGLPVDRIQVIKDNVATIAKAIQEARARNTTLLFTSGGLGPTFDDLTAKGLSLATNTQLKLHPDALRLITDRYEVLKGQGLVESATITPPRQKMALLPQGAEPLLNLVGTAPGIRLSFEPTTIYCLPGVPEELHSMFLHVVAPQIASLTEKIFLQEVTKVTIFEEAGIAPILVKIMKKYPEAYLKSLPHSHQNHKPLQVAITVSAPTHSKAKRLIRQVIKTLQESTQC